uniref:Mediator complex subunit 9 n=1 Tax=Meloidogyne hapla TaxID=6305 RepID=A0A1I8BSZ4_MELHA
MAVAPETDQKFTIVKAIVDTGKETIEIGEKILEQVQGELGDLALFQSDHDGCLTSLVESAKTIANEQQCLTSKVLTSSWDKKQHHQWLANLKEKLKKMQDEFDAGENALRKQSTIKPVSPVPSISNPPATPKRVISKPATPKLVTPKTTAPKPVIQKPITPKRKGKRQAPSQSPPPKKLPLRRIDTNPIMDKTMDTDDNDDSFWND